MLGIGPNAYATFGDPSSPISRMGYIDNYEFRRTLDVQWSGGLPLVDVSIDGMPYKFLFDSGAPTVIPKALVSKMKLRLLEVDSIYDVTGREHREEIYRLPKLSVAGIDFNEFPVLAADFSKSFPLSCVGFDGILGYNMLKRLIVSLDLKAGKITISDSLPSTSGYAQTQVVFDKELIPKVNVRFPFSDGWFGLDTGSNVAGTFANPRAIPKLKSAGYDWTLTRGTTSVSYGGANIDRETHTFVLENFTIGTDIRIKSAPFKVEQSGSAVIGVPLLRMFSIILDLPKQIAYFKPLRDGSVSVPSEPGFGVKPFWDSNKGLFVSSLDDDSPAIQAGLAIGDTILAIDSEDTSRYSKDEFCSLMLEMASNQSPFETQETLEITVRKVDGTVQNGTLLLHRK